MISEMIYKIGDNIISPLGETTAQNYKAVKAGHTQLRRYDHYEGVPDSFAASLLTEEQWHRLAVKGMTRFESLAYHSAEKAIQETGINPAISKAVFILSTTKGNIELLESRPNDSGPGSAAKHIASALGFETTPITVCNACISGVSAIILAMHLLELKSYDYAVVCGADILTPFVISGFLSLKALSQEPCRPFDIERIGLNLGEAAATIVLQRSDQPGANKETWNFLAGATRNDAFHVSSLSKNAEGARLALEAIGAKQIQQKIAFVNAHGTATMFNDQMESVAIERTGLSTPVNAFKGYFGHTLGAAGVLETILSMASVDDHTILGTKGFKERGVSGNILLTSENSKTNRNGFIKMISGFGGCNAAILVSKESCGRRSLPLSGSMEEPIHSITITSTKVIVDSHDVNHEGTGQNLLTNLYKRYIGDYPKYYKMDALCRLGFIASELLLKAENDRREETRSDRAIILFNQSSSIHADLEYQASIQNTDNYYPSPSAFVYTLPNIVTGEIAIRNHYQGETSFYILPQKDLRLMEEIITASFADPATRSVLCGWLDYQDDDHFIAEMFLI